MRPRTRNALAALLLLLAAGGVAAGRFAWRRHAAHAFGARWAPVNERFKQALFLSSQGPADAAGPACRAFAAALAGLEAGEALPGDRQLGADLARAAALAGEACPLAEAGEPAKAHRVLEQVRPIFNDVLRRNGLSALKVALVEFHDQMERVVEAGEGRGAPGVLAALPAAEAGLAAVERELDDARVKAIRAALGAVRRAAEQGASDQLPGAAGDLKSAFVKLYLVEG